VYLIGVGTAHPAAEIADTGTSGTDEVRFAATKQGKLTLYAGDTGIELVVIGTGTGPRRRLRAPRRSTSTLGRSPTPCQSSATPDRTC